MPTRRYQFSLRTLLLVMTGLCVVVAITIVVRNLIGSIKREVDKAIVESIASLEKELEKERPRVLRELSKQLVSDFAKDQATTDRIRAEAVACLHGGTSDERIMGSTVLGELRPTQDVDIYHLLDAAEDSEPRVRAAAEESLLVILNSHQGFESRLEQIAKEDAVVRAATVRRIQELFAAGSE